MIITKLSACAIEAAFPQPFAYLRNWYDKRTTIIVEIETDKRLTGRGGCQGPAEAVTDAITVFTPWLVGENPLQPTVLRQAIYARLSGEAGVHEALTGIYAALWEIKDRHYLLSTMPAAWSGRLATPPAACFEQGLPKTARDSRWPQPSAA